MVAAPIIAASVVLIVFGQNDVGVALFVLAPFMPFLLVQDFWRWTGFMQGRPGRALANDTVFNVVQIAVLVALIAGGYRNLAVAIFAWGLGAIAGSAYGLWQFRLRLQTRGGYAMVAARWHVSRWLLATSVSSWAGSQAYPFFAGPFVGAVGLGGLKAAQSLVTGPSIVLLQAGGSVGLPEASSGLEHGGLSRVRRVAGLVTLTTSLCIGLFAVLIFVAAPQLLGWVYGSQFVPYANTARIIAVAWVVNSLSGGSILILKVTRNTRALFNIGVVNMVTLIAGIVALSRSLGVNGTAWAMLISWTVVYFLFQRAKFTALRHYQADHPERALDLRAGSAPDVVNDVQHDA
jgi:O-antigen/teichoic acid export membrane protein